jgi:uncharacterized coiled-coil protein SlyX
MKLEIKKKLQKKKITEISASLAFQPKDKF